MKAFFVRLWTGIVAAVAGAAVALVVQIAGIMWAGWSIDALPNLLLALMIGGFVIGVLMPPGRPSK